MDLTKQIAETKTLIDSLPDGKQKKQRINHLKRLYRKLRLANRCVQNDP